MESSRAALGAASLLLALLPAVALGQPQDGFLQKLDPNAPRGSIERPKSTTPGSTALPPPAGTTPATTPPPTPPAAPPKQKTPDPGALGEERFEYQPGLVIIGSPEYIKKVREHLDRLKKTPTGQKLLDELAKTGKPVEIRTGNNRFRPDNETDVQPKKFREREDGSIEVLERGPGVGGTVFLDADYTPKNGKGEPCRDPTVILGHELIHALHSARGEDLYYVKFTRDGGKTENHEEARTIGIPPYENEAITDNKIGCDLGYRPRTEHETSCPQKPSQCPAAR